MPNVINFDQSGYIKNRFIGCNIRPIQGLINFTDKYNREGALLFIDFKKAVGSLEWKFLHEVTEKFNFGPNFQKWVQVFYKDPQAVIKNNGGSLNLSFCREVSGSVYCLWKCILP